MEVLKQAHGTGKTSKLVKWLKGGRRLDDGTWSRLLITPTVKQSDYIKTCFESIPSGAVVSIIQYMTLHRVRHPDVVIAIDELDAVLRCLLQAEIDIATLTSLPNREEYDAQLRKL